eukprot:SAG31_NODE_2207_length_6189_cov_5.894253_2_plen_143_part_00
MAFRPHGRTGVYIGRHPPRPPPPRVRRISTRYPYSTDLGLSMVSGTPNYWWGLVARKFKFRIQGRILFIKNRNLSGSPAGTAVHFLKYMYLDIPGFAYIVDSRHSRCTRPNAPRLLHAAAAMELSCCITPEPSGVLVQTATG